MWSQAQAQLQEAVKGKPGAPVGNQNASKENNAARRAALNDPTLGAARKPKDRKSRLIRTLTNPGPRICRSGRSAGQRQPGLALIVVDPAQGHQHRRQVKAAIVGLQ